MSKELICVPITQFLIVNFKLLITIVRVVQMVSSCSKNHQQVMTRPLTNVLPNWPNAQLKLVNSSAKLVKKVSKSMLTIHKATKSVLSQFLNAHNNSPTSDARHVIQNSSSLITPNQTKLLMNVHQEYQNVRPRAPRFAAQCLMTDS